MAITKDKKKELLGQYQEAINNSRAVIITEYRGLSTPQMEALRAAVREADGSVSVVKLTLFKLALEQAGVEAPEELLTGPIAVGFAPQDVPAVVKAIKSFAKDREEFVIKGGLVQDRLLSAADLEAIAELPPLEIVRAQLLGLISGPARNLTSVIASGVRQVVNVLNAYADTDKQEAAAEA